MTDTRKEVVERLARWCQAGAVANPRSYIGDLFGMSADTMRALFAEREALTAEVARLTAALAETEALEEQHGAVIARLTAALAQSRAETQAALAGCVSGEPVAYLHSSDDGSLELVLAQRVNSESARRRIDLGWKSTPLFATIQPDTEQSKSVANLIETAQWARNRLETIADESWRGDARDFKRSLIGVFADFDAALAACGSVIPADFRIAKTTRPDTSKLALVREANQCGHPFCGETCGSASIGEDPRHD